MRIFFIIILVFNAESHETCRTSTANSNMINKNIDLKLFNNITKNIDKERKCDVYNTNLNEKAPFTSKEEFNESNKENIKRDKVRNKKTSPLGNTGSLFSTNVVSQRKFKEVIKMRDNIYVEHTNLTQDAIDEAIQEINYIKDEKDQVNLPLTDKNGKKILKFFWIDAFENRFEIPGVVYLFGRVTKGNNGESVPCCLIVKNIDRHMFLLPRKYKLDPTTLEPTDLKVMMADVQEEFNSVADQLGIREVRFRTVTKKSFDPGVPGETEWLEVRYPAIYPSYEADKTYLTASHVFGSNTSSLEALLLQNKIKGPCWLEVKGVKAVDVKESWCKLEVTTDIKDISLMKTDLEPPPLVAVTVNMRTVDCKNSRHKTWMLCYTVHNSFSLHTTPTGSLEHQKFCLFTNHNESFSMDLKQTVPHHIHVTKCKSQEELLSRFLADFGKIDPDLVIGHKLRGFQQELSVGNASDLSRLTRLKRPPKYAKKRAFLGRLVCDLKVSAMELIKARNYDLDTLTIAVLNVTEDERNEDLSRYYNSGDNIVQLVELTMKDNVYIHKTMSKLNVMPIAFEITRIVGNVMSRTLIGSKSERNEYLLLHAFTEKNYIVPDKKMSRIWTKNTPKYSGGLVLEPKRGFYDKLVLLMDFNSLYPSIIHEYNICFTTSKPNYASDEATSSEFGILPTQIQKLVESRRVVKKLMESALSFDVYKQYDIRQLALKMTANTMYGCLGSPHSRFYASSLASYVAKKGREILMEAKNIVEMLNFEVLYGDTDSLMVNTNSTDYNYALNIGEKLKRQIDDKYKHVQIGIDGVFRYLLLCRKKKYASVLISKNKDEYVLSQEYKGLDIVRRDFSMISAEAGKYVLSQIMSGQNEANKIGNIERYLNKIQENLLSGKIPMSQLIMSKMLARNPEKYFPKNSEFIPHVHVATRLNLKNSRRFKKGDMVPYIICEDGTAKSPMQRAYHVEEINKSVLLKVDYQYYLVQLHSVITRLSEHIKYLNPGRVAKYLGLKVCKHEEICKAVSSRTRTHEKCMHYDVFLCSNECLMFQ